MVHYHKGSKYQEGIMVHYLKASKYQEGIMAHFRRTAQVRVAMSCRCPMVRQPARSLSAAVA